MGSKASKLTQQRKNRALSENPGKSKINHIFIDEFPMYLDNVYYIQIKPQNLILEFNVTRLGQLFSFDLLDVKHLGTYTETITVTSDQILIPLLGLTNIDQDYAIIHYTSEDNFHLRIARTQFNKQWLIHSGQLHLWKNQMNSKPWTIQVSDHHIWSSNNL